ncbi:hypothetical protein HPP92_019062 [Vanilla planifolia]|uniref:Uncharacterized protein n=1 Tax=Vanilla planifolia TaxID=51239 RepID=A0A835Q9K7_VANPL|nr:hypothetical protein HPP92_019062 [Vanilla planifolia]
MSTTIDEVLKLMLMEKQSWRSYNDSNGFLLGTVYHPKTSRLRNNLGFGQE